MNAEKFSVFLKRIGFLRLAGILLLVNLAVSVFLVLPQHNRVLDLESTNSGLKNQLATEQRQLKDLKNRVLVLQESRKDMKDMYREYFLPRDEGVSVIRLELESLIQSLQIKRQEVTFKYSDLPEFGLQLFTLGVPVEGNYRSLRRFINSIERSKHFLMLDRVDLSTEKTADVLNLDFRISTYLVLHEDQESKGE
jgi:Tfp pilus assembly protein PilO